MRARALLVGLPALVASACEPEPGPDDSALPPCHTRCEGSLGEQIVVQVSSDRLDAPISSELNPCVEEALLPDGAPVVVVLSGGFKAVVIPVEPDDRVVEVRPGIVALYPSFPTTAGDFVYEGVGDYRGSGARWATEAALSYATGGVEDLEGCTLSERIKPPLSAQPPWLHGQSNGGNLAIAVLADSELTLPEIGGVTTFETPASAQFVTLEVGSEEHPLPLYEPGSCAWSPDQGLVCALDYSSLGWDPHAESEDGHRGLAFFDLDHDGIYDEGEDSPVWGIRPEVEGDRWIVYSPSLTQALREAGEDPAGLLQPDELEAFWASRDASLAVQQAVARHPELPFLVLGTATDHNLGIEDHAHVTGLAAALQGAGARWVRVNPDTTFIELLTGAALDWVDNPANQPTWPGDPAQAMLPDADTVGAHTRHFVTAALAELMQRRWRDRWEEDLDQVLLP
jgi:hypothetical protein